MTAQRSIERTRIVRVKVRDLVVHPVAQRVVVKSKARNIAMNLDLGAIGTLHAVEYPIGGKLAKWVVDGQHRLTALLDNGLGDLDVNVELHLDVKDDARACQLFLNLNNRTAVGTMDKYFNEVVAGEIAATGVDNVLDRRELRVAKNCGPGTLQCTEALKTVWEFDQGKTLAKTLDVIMEAWGTDTSGFEGELIKGISKVIFKTNGNIDSANLVKKLSKETPARIIGRARAIRDAKRGAMWKHVAEMIVASYNTGKSSKKLELAF